MKAAVLDRHDRVALPVAPLEVRHSFVGSEGWLPSNTREGAGKDRRVTDDAFRRGWFHRNVILDPTISGSVDDMFVKVRPTRWGRARSRSS